MGKRMASTAAVVALLAPACGGGDSATPPPLAPTDVSAETQTPADVSAETPIPTDVSAETPTPADVSAETPTPADVSAETPTPADVSAETPDEAVDEAAVIAAWERYLDLSIQARGKAPSAEALDYSSYTTGRSTAALRETEQADVVDGRYVLGRAVADRPNVEFLGPDSASISDCVDVDLSVYRRSDDSFLGSQVTQVSTVGRLERIAEEWLVAGQDTAESCAE